MFDYRAHYEGQLLVSADFLRVVQFSIDVTNPKVLLFAYVHVRVYILHANICTHAKIRCSFTK